MKKIKHNKIKNTGLIFEILSRMVMKETLDQSLPQNALKVIKAHFKPNSLLLKELRLYQILNSKTDLNASELLEATLNSCKKINKEALRKEKFNLVKSINKFYNPDVFFETRVSNYRHSASVFKLLESTVDVDPESYLTAKKLVLETLTGKVQERAVEDEVFETFKEQDPDVRKLGFKIIIEKFNAKYRELSDKQKRLLSKYINEDPNREDFKDFVLSEVSWIVKNLKTTLPKVQSEITKIKLNEAINLTQEIISAKKIKEEHLSSMLKFYELVDVLNNGEVR